MSAEECILVTPPPEMTNDELTRLKVFFENIMEAHRPHSAIFFILILSASTIWWDISLKKTMLTRNRQI